MKPNVDTPLGPIQAVLFDLDGTLLDSAPDLAAAANALRAARGLPDLPLLHYRPFVGTGARGMLRIALGTAEAAPDFEQLREEFFQAYEHHMGQHARLFGQVEQLIRTVTAQGLGWGIVTNKIQRFTLPITQACPVLSQAQAVICGDSTPHIKPHPAPLQAAAAQLKVSAPRCIYIGDDARDIQAAKAADMIAVAASYGYLGNTADVRDWQPDAVIHTPLQLLSLLGWTA